MGSAQKHLGTKELAVEISLNLAKLQKFFTTKQMNQLHLEEWVKFCQTTFPNNEVPPYPTKKSELPFTYQLAVDDWNEGKLSQNLFANKTVGAGLPADLQLRLQQNALLPSDGDALRKAGLTFYAGQCDTAAARLDAVALEKSARESAERAAAETKAYEEFSKLPLGAKPPTPEAIAAARQQYWGHQ